jgi:hypothetical protein
MVPAGSHSLPVVEPDRLPGVALVRVRSGELSFTFRQLSIGRISGGHREPKAPGRALPKAAAALDTLHVSKSGYCAKSIALDGYKGTVDVEFAVQRVPSCEEILAQPGRISDSDLHKADCYDLSSEVSDSARTAWNAYCKEWILDKAWDQGIPRFRPT